MRSSRAPILLDGAMGTELAARGFDLREPLFSARALLDAPELVERIHWEYLLAGAQVLTSNSFGLHIGTLALAGLATRQAELIARALGLFEMIRRRASQHERELASFRVAGSLPPRPLARLGEVADPALARAEYRRFADLLIDAGADVVLLETFTSVAEARLALEGLHGFEHPVWLSLVAGVPVPGSNRPEGSRLLGGDSFTELAGLLDDAHVQRPELVAINCTQIDAIPAALAAMHDALDPGIPLGLAPHLGRRRYDGVWIDRFLEPEVFAEQLHMWLASRPRLALAGACCGSNPEYLAAMRRRLQGDAPRRQDAWIRLAELLP